MFKAVILPIACLFLVSCGNIQHFTKPLTPMGDNVQLYPGDTVIEYEKYRNLENAFGKADMFGRKTFEGFVRLVYDARVDDILAFELYRVDIITNETTLDRAPAMTTINSYGGGPYQRKTYTATTYAPRGADSMTLPQKPRQILAKVGDTFDVGDYSITVLSYFGDVIVCDIRRNQS